MSLFSPLEEFIYEYKLLLSDSESMVCDQDHDLPLIRALQVMCQPQTVDYMLILAVAEAVLLVGVVANLAYDAWHYHKTGEMPWLARNICLGLSYSGGFRGDNFGSAQPLPDFVSKVPLPVRFGWCSCRYGRIGRAAGQLGGTLKQKVVPNQCSHPVGRDPVA